DAFHSEVKHRFFSHLLSFFQRISSVPRHGDGDGSNKQNGKRDQHDVFFHSFAPEISFMYGWKRGPVKSPLNIRSYSPVGFILCELCGTNLGAQVRLAGIVQLSLATLIGSNLFSNMPPGSSR